MNYNNSQNSTSTVQAKIPVDVKTWISKPCLICEDPVKLTDIEEYNLRCGGTVIKVCDKCKQAILHIRQSLSI